MLSFAFAFFHPFFFKKKNKKIITIPKKKLAKPFLYFSIFILDPAKCKASDERLFFSEISLVESRNLDMSDQYTD